MNNTTTLFLKGCLSLLLGFVALGLKAQTPLEADSAATLPGYVVFVKDTAQMRVLTDDETFFYASSRGVTFKVNKYDLNLQSDFIVELRDSVLPEVRRRGWELAGIGLRGAASPEGPYRWNVTLSQCRAQAIIDFLQVQMKAPSARKVRTRTVAEDYVYLLMLMEEADDPDVGLVKDIMSLYADDIHKLKVALQVAQGGRLWRRLLREYYPRLRTARMILYFHPDPNRISTIVAQPQRKMEVRVRAVDTDSIAYEDSIPVPEPRPHMLSVSTNLAYYGLYVPHYGWAPMPNFELEFYPRRGNWTALFSFTCPYWHDWSHHRFFQIRDYHFEGRYYFGASKLRGIEASRLHVGWFVGAYANTTIYGIGWSRTAGWEGEGGGAAVKGGYVWPLGKQGRWRLELSAAVGGYVTRYDPYVFGNPISGVDDGKYYYDYTGNASDFNRRNYRRTWFGPTELAIKLRCDVLFWKHGRGVSFKRKEVGR